jgi:hypothetical protein
MASHWRNEITAAMAAGKTIIVLLDEVDQVFVATGERSFSGTGRNQKTTRIVEVTDNYSLCPISLSPTNTTGKEMSIEPSATFIAEYWKSFGKESEYRIAIGDKGLLPLVRTKAGNRVVGAYIYDNRSSGALIFLPYIEFDRPGFTRSQNKETYWTAKAVSFGNKYVGSIVHLAEALKQQAETTPPPDWVQKHRYMLATEMPIRKELLKLETEMRELQEKVNVEKQKLLTQTQLKELLYEKGKPLEHAIVQALEMIGFKAVPFRNQQSEFDVVFESTEGRAIAEAEGKDNKSINIDKLRQLTMNLAEDLERDEVQTLAKGVLIGNAYRLSEPESRADFFTAKCQSSAQTMNVGLLRSTDLYDAARLIQETNDSERAVQFRKKILGTVGLIDFEIPQRSTFEETDST